MTQVFFDELEKFVSDHQQASRLHEQIFNTTVYISIGDVTQFAVDGSGYGERDESLGEYVARLSEVANRSFKNWVERGAPTSPLYIPIASNEITRRRTPRLAFIVEYMATHLYAMESSKYITMGYCS